MARVSSAYQQPGLGSRLLLAAGVLVVLAVPYPLLNSALPPRLDLSTPLDRALPFLPWTLVLYACWLVLPALAVALTEGADFQKLLRALAISAIACYLGFALFTSHYPRPALETIDPGWRGAYAFLGSFDGPGNTFPSLHVAVTATVALRMRRRRLAWAWIAAATLVSLSTLTTKQHFVADLLGAVAVAAVAVWLVDRGGRST